MIRTWIAKNEIIVMLLALAIISAVVYLPLVGSMGYMNDDWYLMYSAKAYGSQAFIDIFSIDRPARALVMIPLYGIFGGNPLYYNLSAYLFRLFSAFAFLWSLDMLFPRRRGTVFLMSLLFLIYPGFLSQPNAIDYQSHLVGLAAAHLSIALTIKAILVKRNAIKIILHSLSVLFGLLYLSQMEWYIGFEIFRWAGVFLLSSRMGGSLIQKIWRSIRQAFPAFIVPGIFLIWRLFFFESERGATDLAVQFEQAKLYPIQIIYHWAVQVLQDLFDVTFSAWVIPLSQLMGYIRLWGGVLAIVLAGVSLYVLHLYKDQENNEALPEKFSLEALLFGLVIAVGGLIPIAMVNRDVSFPSFSRYSLVSSAGVAIFIGACLFQSKRSIIRNAFVALLVVISVLTHHANALKAIQQAASIRNFWWQVSWRVPQIEQNTTLVANYPGASIEEDYFVWGPANLVYYPDRANNKAKIRPVLYAIVLDDLARNKIQYRMGQEYDKRRNILTFANYSNLLIITQPSSRSCVQLISGGPLPEVSSFERSNLMLAAQYSEAEHVILDSEFHTPPEVVFGAEPPHDWCFYYEKASLARQRGKWDDVLQIGEQAFGLGFEPKDPIEWMPFLQAYALDENIDRLTELAPKISADPYISLQICQILGATPGLSSEVIETVNTSYCPQ